MWRHYVYEHRKADTGEVFYVGKGSVRVRCKKQVFERANCTTSRSSYWNNVANKHGYTVHIIASFITDKDSQEFEKQLISEYGRENLVNLTDGGDGHAGIVVSDDLRKKRSESASRKRSAAWVSSIRKARENGGNGGVVRHGDKLSKSWRENISKGVTGENNSQYGKVTAVARKVVDIETGEEYESVTSAADSVGLKMKTLYNKLNGHRPNDTNLRFA